jgi:ABC-type phosphate transport system substrate-binding protein
VEITRSSWRGLAVLGTVAAAGLSLFAFAGSATAAQPAGIACQSADGKVSGRGATFARQLWDSLINGYTADVCGAVANTAAIFNTTVIDPTDPSVVSAPATVQTTPNAMVVYNYNTAQTGSGQGRTAMQCRTDAFGGTDGPYSTAQYALLNAAPLAVASCPIPSGGGTGTTRSPFLPGPLPNAADATAPMMSFPIGGASVVIAVNLTGAACTTAPTSLSFTSAQVDGIMDGRFLLWSDPALVAGNPLLANCATPITRRVRSDDSGTTQIIKNYLAKVDPSSPGCDGAAAASDWLTLRNANAPNNKWPNLAQVNPANPSSAPATATCSAISSLNGNGGVAGSVNGNPGSVGYIDVADAAITAPLAIRPSIRNATDTAFIAPSTGAQANCNFNNVSAPPGPEGAVGLIDTDNWASNNATLRSDITNIGPGYPICGLTFAMVYTGLSGTPGTTAVSGMTNNQRRTLYSFMSYALSNVAQNRLNSALYRSLPGSLLANIRTGFQGNF